MRLTDANVAAAACPEGRKDALVFDDTLPGFGLRVTAAGKRTFLFQYRNGGKVRRQVLGTWGTELTTAAARRKAEALRGQVREQRDPVAEGKERKAAALRADAKAKAAAAAASFTVELLIDQWTAHHLAERSAHYRLIVPRDLKNTLSKWVSAPADSLAQADAIRILDDVKAKRGPVAANRLRAYARACWSWAMRRGSLATNPWQATPRPSRERARERVLDDEELADLWRATEQLTFPWRPVVQLLILTGQRRGEVAGMRWSELDLDKTRWSLPGSRTKNGRAHTVPLAPPALRILKDTPRMAGSDLVFEGPRRTAPTGFGKAKARLDTVMAEAAAAAGRTVPEWVLHDLRRSVATGLQRLGVRLEVTEAVLNHVSGSRAGIVGVYQRHGWEREKAEALEAWAAHLIALETREDR